MALLSALATEIVIPACATVGIAYSYYLVRWFPESRNSDSLDDAEQDLTSVKAEYDRMRRGVSEGVEAFLFTEYWYGGVFMVAFAILIFLCLGSVESFSTQSRPCRFDPSNMCKPALATAVFSAVSFLLGAFTSVLSGFLGMKIAIYAANARTAFKEGEGDGKAFFSAFRSSAVMGFLLAAKGLLVLYIAIYLFKLYYGDDWEGLFAAIAGYGLGGSSMALLGRAAGGIYAKIADVSYHLIKENWPAADQVYVAVIYDYVGDIVGDIAETKEVKEIKPALRKQLIISTILMTFGIVIVSWIALPSSFTVYNFGSQKVVKNWQLCFCVGVGLWFGLIIEFITKLCTNDGISLFQEFAAERVGFGLAFVDIPIFTFLSILLSYRIASVYGIAVAAVGMLSTIATRLAINAYSPISDHARPVSKRIGGRGLRDVQSSSNTRATIGKGFTIESTSLVSMALFGAFVSRAAISPVDVLTLKVFMGSIVGAMLPKWFSAMTMKRVGPPALEMAYTILRESVRYHRCFKISIDASFRGMIRPVALVMLTPLIVGTFLGIEMLSGVLAGSLGSVVRIAISASNTGGAWEKARKYIRAGASEYAKTEYAKTHFPKKIHRAVDKGDTIGNPLKDTSGPPLNILIQLMVVESLVFAPFFTTHGGLLFKII
ncbi:pyrophosphate-energized vacuolar membrane proton pump isoform X2 [Eucalyptus grandis]|uniref:pyrophosphate-energized vacuolar membrane proton pump isoform X2 n=1 Tax=Eucalyptus grandis TaxID=71139 RepID=UPI000524A40B|nr:pyrophosphate-energized vacuolar membrane proton pump isoform X2 [Eucalyptus grandis]